VLLRFSKRRSVTHWPAKNVLAGLDYLCALRVYYAHIYSIGHKMPPTSLEQQQRRAAIRDLLAHGPAATQASLVRALEDQGFAVTQSSVSRDLRELGAVKTTGGYELPSAEGADESQVGAVADLLRSVTPAGSNLLVIHTGIGAAQRVALALDRSGWPGMVGTIAGDDTIFVATESAHAQKTLIARIEKATRS
jgi:transcriptional regulator of arginine metabolism